MVLIIMKKNFGCVLSIFLTALSWGGVETPKSTLPAEVGNNGVKTVNSIEKVHGRKINVEEC